MGCSQSKPFDVATPAATVHVETAESMAVEKKGSEELKVTETQLRTEEEDHVDEVPRTLEPVASGNNKPLLSATEQTPDSCTVDVPDSVRANFSSFNISFIDPTVSAPTSVSTEPNVASTRVAVVSEKVITSVTESAAKDIRNVEAQETVEKSVSDEVAVDEVATELNVEKEETIEPGKEEAADQKDDTIDELKVEEDSNEKVEEIAVETEASEEKSVKEITVAIQEERKTEVAVAEPVAVEAVVEMVEEVVDSSAEDTAATIETSVVTSRAKDSDVMKSEVAEEEKPLESGGGDATEIEASAALEAVEKKVEAADIIAVEEPADIIAEEPAVIIAVEEPAGLIAVEEPAATIAVEEPAVIFAEEEPAVIIAVEEPAGLIAVGEHADVIAVEEHAAVIEESVEKVSPTKDQGANHTAEEVIVELVKEQIVEQILKSAQQKIDVKTVDASKKDELKVETVAEQIDKEAVSGEDEKVVKAVEVKIEDFAGKPAAVEETVKHLDVAQESSETIEGPHKVSVSTDNQTEVQTESMHSLENESDGSTLSEDEAEDSGMKQPDNAEVSTSVPAEEAIKAMEPEMKETASSNQPVTPAKE